METDYYLNVTWSGLIAMKLSPLNLYILNFYASYVRDVGCNGVDVMCECKLIYCDCVEEEKL